MCVSGTAALLLERMPFILHYGLHPSLFDTPNLREGRPRLRMCKGDFPGLGLRQTDTPSVLPAGISWPTSSPEGSGGGASGQLSALRGPSNSFCVSVIIQTYAS